jgi:uncharacterized membrane protein YvlD (DUF360 family)
MNMSAVTAIELLSFMLLIIILVATISIWLVGKLGLGLKVSSIGAAFVAGLSITVVFFVISMILALLGINPSEGLATGIVNSFSVLIVLMLANRIGKGLRVTSLTGALVSAIAIAALTWLIGLIVTP